MPTTVSSLHVYPVKGLKGIDLDAARCTDRGLEHDRRWMVVDSTGTFMTQREHPRMATVWTDIRSGFLELSAPDVGAVAVPLAPPPAATQRVRVWKSVCDALPVSREADQWLTEYLGVDCRLVHMPDASERLSNPEYAGAGKRVGFADGYAYLLIGEASLADLNRRMAERGQAPLPMNRFRPNIVLAGSEAYAEDGWKDTRIGSATLRGVKPCGRCQVTTTDQSTGEVRGPEPLATLTTYRDSPEFGVMFGMNFVTVREGTVRVGDAVN
ncbi:MAG TPA: MOSC N-terminal beta barrel domain-containing protein [Usitatibacter sp.]|nr:MOSC N-terminal beta barrel domain-containing protein [Usitatibacter sp.]